MRRGLILLPLMVLGACAGGQKQSFQQAFTSCLFDTDAPGSYEVREGNLGRNGLPLIYPAEGGTAQGATALNACVETRITRRPARTSAPKAKEVKAAPGRLPLPAGYVLTPEEQALWPTLTLAQQQRALEFLRDGSTIQSSLLGD